MVAKYFLHTHTHRNATTTRLGREAFPSILPVSEGFKCCHSLERGRTWNDTPQRPGPGTFASVLQQEPKRYWPWKINAFVIGKWIKHYEPGRFVTILRRPRVRRGIEWSNTGIERFESSKSWCCKVETGMAEIQNFATPFSFTPSCQRERGCNVSIRTGPP